MLNLLDSLDTARILTLCNGNKDKVKLALTFLMSFVGMPCTYYGTEIAMEGENDPDCRRTFDWNEENWDDTFHNYYKKIISIRKEYKPLTVGTVRFTYDKDIFVMERCYEHEKVVVVLNNSEDERTYQVERKGEVKELLTGELIKKSDVLNQVIKPYQAKLYYMVDEA